MTSTLELLLVQLRDGAADASVLARARALLSGDERLPEDVREVALLNPTEAAEDAVALLSLLGVDDLGAQLRDALWSEVAAEEAALSEAEVDDGWAEIGLALREGLLAEAGEVDLASAVLRRVPLVDFAWGPILADAVQGEAGVLDVTAAVLATVDPERTPEITLREALLAEAGEVDLADGVLSALGIETFSVREAVLAECGRVDVVDAVMEPVLATAALRSARAAVVLVDAAPPSPVARAVVPRPANNVRRFGVVAFAMAAIALLSVWVGGLVAPTDDGDSLLFAQAGDVVIEDLSTGDDVSVVQLEGDDGSVILWIDEEAG